MCRERAAQRPQDFCVNVYIAGAAMQPYRDTRPLPQDGGDADLAPGDQLSSNQIGAWSEGFSMPRSS